MLLSCYWGSRWKASRRSQSNFARYFLKKCKLVLSLVACGVCSSFRCLPIAECLCSVKRWKRCQDVYRTDHMTSCKQRNVGRSWEVWSFSTLMSSMSFLLVITGRKSLPISFLLSSLKSLQLIVQIYKLLHTALTTKARVVKVKHDLIHSVLRVNQNKTLPLIFLTGIHAKNDGGSTVWHPWHTALWLRVAQCLISSISVVMFCDKGPVEN